MYELTEIKKRLSCAEYLSRHGIHVKNGGRCVSPLRSGADNPTSFWVNDEHWHDFGSGYHGDIIDLVALMQFNGDLGAAIRYLADEMGLQAESSYPDTWKDDIQRLCHRTAAYHAALTEADYDYLKTRGVTKEAADRLMIGRVTDTNLKGRLFLPYFKNGYVCYYATRALPDGAYPESKYRKASIKESQSYRHIPWGLQTLNRESDTLIISEGYFDAVSWEMEGFPVISPITGSFSRDQWPEVLAACRMFKRVLIIFDNDEISHAGEGFTYKTASMLFQHRIPFVVGHTPQGVKDVNDYYVGGGSLQDIVDGAQDGVEYMDSHHSGFIFHMLGTNKGITGDDWILNSFGIRHKLPPKKGEEEGTWEVVTPTPVFPSAYIENTTEGIHKVELKLFVNDEVKTIVCNKEIIANKAKLISLADAGLGVNSNNASSLIQYFSVVEQLNRKSIPRYRSVSHLGWVGDDFLPYGDSVKFDGETNSRSLYAAISQKGDFEAWVDYTHELRKNRYLRLMMAASFASPLIERVNTLPFVFHLWGSTGKGKTVALMVAMSIWGDPNLGQLTRTMNMTNAAMMDSVALLRNLPFGGDELQTIKTNDMNYDKLIMQITEGIERGRMYYNRQLPTRSWYCAFLFTGEERCTNDFSGGGTKNRVFEVEAEGEIVENGNAVCNFIKQNYGHAGRRFIEHVAKRDLTADYTDIFHRVIGTCDTTQKQAMAAAMLLLGDKIACECLYPNETPLTVYDVAPYLKCESEVDVAIRAYDYITGWIAVNIDKFNGVSNNGVWGLSCGRSMFIIDYVLCKELQNNGFTFDAVKKSWADKGFVRKYGSTFKQRKRINGESPYCIEIIMPA